MISGSQIISASRDEDRDDLDKQHRDDLSGRKKRLHLCATNFLAREQKRQKKETSSRSLLCAEMIWLRYI